MSVVEQPKSEINLCLSALFEALACVADGQMDKGRLTENQSILWINKNGHFMAFSSI